MTKLLLLIALGPLAILIGSAAMLVNDANDLHRNRLRSKLERSKKYEKRPEPEPKTGQ